MNQSTLNLNLFTVVLIGVLSVCQSAGWSQAPGTQGDGDLLPLPVTGYDFTHAGNDAYGEYDLTLYEDAEIIYDPQRGHVLQLEGTGYALSENADLNVGEGFSLCLWIKVSLDCPDNNFLVGQGFGSYLYDYSFYLLKRPQSDLMWRYLGTGGFVRHVTEYDRAEISDGLWHHIAVNHDTELGYSSIYVDGILQSTTDNIGAIENKQLGLFVGYVHPDSYGKGNRLPFIGCLDDIGFYRTVLTEPQIHQVMINGLSGYNPEIAVPGIPEKEAELHENSVVLQWQPGRHSASHTVYLSSDVNAVSTQRPEACLGSTTSTQIEVTGLNWGTTYYWRVDEVNEAFQGSPWLGPIWSFRTLGTVLVDDFESYNLYDPDGPYLPNHIYEAWLDRWGYTDANETQIEGNHTGMTAGEWYYLAAPTEVYKGFAGSAEVKYEGLSSLALEYDNTQWPYYSEAQRTLDLPKDWTTDGFTDMTYLCVHYLGTILPPSRFEVSGDQYIVTGTGADIWDQADECTFVSVPLLGNGAITVKVESIENTAEWARAGIMIRDGLAANARHMAAVVTPAHKTEHLVRTNTGGSTSSTGLALDVSMPHWLKLTRQGDVLTAQHSADGQQWQDLGSAVYWGLSDEVQVGLVVNSYVDGKTTCQGVFSHVQINGTIDGTLDRLTNIGLQHNDPEYLYVTVQDAKGQSGIVMHPDNPSALLVDQWTEWRIPLSELEVQGVDLSHIRQLTIGVGDTPAQGNIRNPGGHGKFYVDQIRLMAEE
ncbi:MAG: hypothetical protein K9N55_10105 [Phycisphaerae bacterium]|nr:hypothetical protein [Phycisphaerae bacterium]